MDQCKNRMGERCKLDGSLCKHLVYDGCCKNADVDHILSVTFKDALEVILKTDCCNQRKINHKRNYVIVLETTGLKWDDPIEKFEYEVAETMIDKLKEKYKPSTIQSILGSIYYAGNIRFRTVYKDKTMKRPVFERYAYKARRSGGKVVLTWDQKNKIHYEMESQRRKALDKTLCERKRIQARNIFIALWWGWYYGTRNGDVNNMKWGNFIIKNGIPHVEWTPQKTQKYETKICWPIPEDAYNSINPFLGNSGDYCLISDEKFIPKNKREYKKKHIHTYLWKHLNKFFRGIGLSGWAAFYSLRYMNAQQAYKNLGSEAESMKMGHNQSTANRSYYDKNDHSFALG